MSEINMCMSMIPGSFGEDDICRAAETDLEMDYQFDNPDYLCENDTNECDNAILSNNDEPPKMSNDFYDSFEAFLKKPAPKLRKSQKDCNDGSNMPNISATAAKQANQTRSSPPIPPASKATSKIKSIIHGRNNSQIKAIDENLLKEAFAYAESLGSMMAMSSEDVEEENSNKTTPRGPQVDEDEPDKKTVFHEKREKKSVNPPTKKTIMKTPSKGVNHSHTKSGLVNKLRKQTSDIVVPTQFDLSASPEDDGKRLQVDFDALVSNFENGTLLQKLKAELEESQRSLQKTTDNMRRLTRETINGKR